MAQVVKVTFAIDLRPLERARIDLRAAKALLSFVDSAGNVERYPVNFEHFR